MARSGVLTSGELKELRDSGAVCAFNFHFLDENGSVVKSPVTSRTLAIPFDTLCSMPTKIVLAFGPRKVMPLAVLASNSLADVLITDEPTARGLMSG
jgi:DNA-binding transcriptional regulator LsrR (DeoR family)